MTQFTNTSGGFYTQALFYEMTGADKSTVVYTLKDRDHAGYPSLYRLYMAAEDPLEFTFATTHLDSYAHWLRLLECDWFKPLVSRWRKELELKLRSEALVRLREDAKSPSRTAAMSNRFLLLRGWDIDEPGVKRGRPSKADIKAEAKRLATETTQQDADLARMTSAVN